MCLGWHVEIGGGLDIYIDIDYRDKDFNACHVSEQREDIAHNDLVRVRMRQLYLFRLLENAWGYKPSIWDLHLVRTKDGH